MQAFVHLLTVIQSSWESLCNYYSEEDARPLLKITLAKTITAGGQETSVNNP